MLQQVCWRGNGTIRGAVPLSLTLQFWVLQRFCLPDGPVSAIIERCYLAFQQK